MNNSSMNIDEYRQLPDQMRPLPPILNASLFPLNVTHLNTFQMSTSVLYKHRDPDLSLSYLWTLSFWVCQDCFRSSNGVLSEKQTSCEQQDVFALQTKVCAEDLKKLDFPIMHCVIHAEILNVKKTVAK